MLFHLSNGEITYRLLPHWIKDGYCIFGFREAESACKAKSVAPLEQPNLACLCIYRHFAPLEQG